MDKKKYSQKGNVRHTLLDKHGLLKTFQDWGFLTNKILLPHGFVEGKLKAWVEIQRYGSPPGHSPSLVGTCPPHCGYSIIFPLYMYTTEDFCSSHETSSLLRLGTTCLTSCSLYYTFKVSFPNIVTLGVRLGLQQINFMSL